MREVAVEFRLMIRDPEEGNVEALVNSLQRHLEAIPDMQIKPIAMSYGLSNHSVKKLDVSITLQGTYSEPAFRMPFGKYQGMTLAEIASRDRGYLELPSMMWSLEYGGKSIHQWVKEFMEGKC